MNKKLVKFLRRRGLLIQFCVNMYNLNSSVDAVDDSYLHHVDKEDLISSAFAWMKSPEGHKFWDQISQGWRREYFMHD